MSEYWVRRPRYDAALVYSVQEITDWLAAIPADRLDLRPAWPATTEIVSVAETNLYDSDFVVDYEAYFDGGLSRKKVYGKFGQYLVLSTEASRFEAMEPADFTRQFEPVV